MRLRSPSVSKKEKNEKLRNKYRSKKKHKRLDAICEQDYGRNHRGDQKAEFTEFANGDHEMELRRSKRCRRTPVLLDSSPLPPKKRRKVFKSISHISENDRGGNDVHSELQPSCSRDLDGQHAGWQLRLRSRGNIRYTSRKNEGKFTARSKRNLFATINDYRDIIVTENGNKEVSSNEKSTIVKSKRPGRIKAAKIMTIGQQNIDSEGSIENCDENPRDLVLGNSYASENELGCRCDAGTEAANAIPVLAEKEEISIRIDSIIEESHTIGSTEELGNRIGINTVVPDQGNGAEVDEQMDKQVKHDEFPHKLTEVASGMPDRECNKPPVLDGKSTISLGRRCALCGGGDDGKPPKVLMLDGACSDNEECSMSFASEEPNYDVWDGFGDHSSWLGQLLGPIIDRFGIAGIWVHQQCAVWSPEVYFSGLGCLKNVRAALYRGRMLKCTRCGRAGATIGCRVDRCPKTYHLPCARDRGCIFDHRKFLIACNDHRQLFQPHGVQNALWLNKMKTKKMKLELLKNSNNAFRKDVEAEEKLLENCGEDEEFLKRESKRLHRDLQRISPTYIGCCKPENGKQFPGWETVAGLKNVIQCMKEVVILPLLYPEFFSNLGIIPPRGVLLHGHPGTGKTLVLRALIGSCARGDTRIAYFARKGADCLGKYVGDAERQLRLLFQVAEKSQPSIIIFDEIDGLAPCRTRKQDQTHNSVVSTLLALMDGLKSRGSVIVIGTTNRPDSVDPALRRPGRFDREIYFPLPSVKDREEILSLHTEKWTRPLTGFLLKWVAKKTVGFAGADLQALCTQAVTIALRRNFPLQEVLSDAETGRNDGKRLAIPEFVVEEDDWLKALTYSPPPCSKRESGVALNDVITSPLKIHFFSCLLLPLTRLLLFLQLDDHVWLPKHLDKASSLVKSIIVSTLDRRREQTDKWWLYMDGLLHETDVMNEIERSLLLETALVEQGDVHVSDDAVEECSLKSSSPSSQFMGTHQQLLRNMPSQSSQMAGFHLLLCGNPGSGQRHLASCLLHCCVGSLDFYKLDLASIFLEGCGDLIHGLRRSLMRCAGANFCLLYMPRLDLWAVDTVNGVYEYEPTLSLLEEPNSSTGIFHGPQSGLDVGSGQCSAPGTEGSQSMSCRKQASYLWISFLEFVESISVKTSLIILATSDLPYHFLPTRIKEFFGDDIMNCGFPNSLVCKLPRVSMQLDGKFDRDNVIISFAAKLSKDLVQHMVHSYCAGSHIVCAKPPEGKVYDIIHGDDISACHAKSVNISPSTPLGSGSRPQKGKTSLQIAISTFGYQILMYPHFAELCWITSKLKEGPSAKTDGPWRGWPFHSCIIRPSQSIEGIASPGLSSIKSKEPGVVHGLVAVGLRAYRGEYTSPKKVCCEVRKVLEILVRQIDEKINGGKNQVQFFRVLSQVAYLDDMVTGMAHALQGLDVENVDDHASQTSANGGSLNGRTGNDAVTNAHGEDQKPDVTEFNSSGNVAAEKFNPELHISDGSFHEASNACNGFTGPNVEVEDTSMEATPQDPLHSSDRHRKTTESGHVSPRKLSNGFRDSSSYLQSDGPAVASDYQHFATIAPPVVNGEQSTDPSSEENSTGSKDLSKRSNAITCFYQCCSDCFTSLHKLLIRIIGADCGHAIRSVSNIEDLHDILSAFSAHLHLDLSKLHLGDGPPVKTGSRSGKSFEHMSIKDCCCCHEASPGLPDKQQCDCSHSPRFVFNNGVLSSSLEAGSNIVYHCKFEKLCLCHLIEWLATRKGVS